jgi:hypothetical protein
MKRVAKYMKLGFTRAVAVAGLFLIVVGGCSRNPTLSPAGYQQALALLNTCQRKDEKALQRLQDSLDKAIETSELTAEEASLLSGLIEKARKGDWDKVVSRTRTLLEKQAGSSKPTASASSSGDSRHRHGR